jgi:hypothetical protein
MGVLNEKRCKTYIYILFIVNILFIILQYFYYLHFFERPLDFLFLDIFEF